jgi:glycosyltransferase involved in cell wall biosynthesis
MARIVILIGGHLCNAPRPYKEAEALSKSGHDVTIAGIWFDPNFIERDRLLILNKKWKFEPIVDFQPDNIVNNWIFRFRSRFAIEMFRRFGIFSPDLLGYGAKEMLKYAKKAKADLTIVHSEGGLWVGSHLLDKGFRVGVDFEDWFSEDLLADARVDRPIKQLKILEKKLMNECWYCLTTSSAMANNLAKAYQSNLPTVIYNTFPWEERTRIDGKICDRKDPNLPSIHWFSQTIGAGRGLETLFQALPYICYPIEIHLRGNCPKDYRQKLNQQIPSEWINRIFIHPTVANNELLSRISEHDIGLSLEVSNISSRNLTITNKFFQYLQAGLAIIATDTEGQSEIISDHSQIGTLVLSNDPSALAQAINDMISDQNKLRTYKLLSLQAAREKFCWEIEGEKIRQLVKEIL